MRKLRALWMRLAGLGRRRDDRDLVAELESHVAMHVEDGIRSGLDPTEAHRQALLKLGGMEQTRQAYRERRTMTWLESLVQDLRYGMRTLLKSPGFTTVAVVTLALGIGATSTAFTVADAALLRSWPAREPQQLVRILASTPQGVDSNFSYPDAQDMATKSKSLDGILTYALSLIHI